MLPAEARSWPSGFSSTTRAPGVTSPAAARLRQMVSNSAGAVDRKNTRTAAGLFAEFGGELLIVGRIGGIQAHVVEAAAERGPARRVQARGQILLAALLDLREVVIALDAGARDAHNSCARGIAPQG
jgi:hypothetical protein